MGGDAVSPAPSGWSAAAEPSLDAPERVDPYHVWAHHSAWEGFGGGGLPEQLRVLFEVGGDKPPTERLIAVIASNPLNRGNTRFCTANIQGKDLALLVDLVREGILVRYQLGLARRPAPDVSGTEPLPKLLDPLELLGVSGSSPRNIVRTLGVVDDGCCLAHAGLHTDWKSHFLCVWDQNQIAAQCVRDPWARYQGISYGEELTMGAINTLLGGQMPSGEIEELRFYNEALRRKSWGHAERSHGAGVLDVLAAMSVDARVALRLGGGHLWKAAVPLHEAPQGERREVREHRVGSACLDRRQPLTLDGEIRMRERVHAAMPEKEARVVDARVDHPVGETQRVELAHVDDRPLPRGERGDASVDFLARKGRNSTLAGHARMTPRAV